ncbi:hypothetical protein KC315_g6423 [Hortaea werneckii]|nr:hypothetical protein KC315_g6423 [Hortaea werneckii]
MADEAFIANRLAECGINPDAESIQIVQSIAVHGKTGMKSQEICALSANLTRLAGKSAAHVSRTASKALSGAHAVLGFVASIFQLVSDLQDRKETDAIAQRHLQGLDAAIGLAPESIRIVAAVKQIVERGFDEHELRSSDAETNVTCDLLASKINPLVQNLEDVDDRTVSSYYKRLIARIDIHRKNAHIDHHRFSHGVANMNGDYQIHTNHLVRYSNACLLDAVLGYYELLLSNRLKDGLIQNNVETFCQRNKDVVCTIEKALESYTNGRLEMIHTNYFYE